MTGMIAGKTRVLVVVLFALLILAMPAVAEARVVEYQVQFMPAGSGGVSQMIVNVILAPDTELPATVRVPIPAGATVVWSGEIVGEDPALDPYREATVSAASGGQVVEFVVTESRVVQVEADYVPPTRSGQKVTSALSWVNTGEDAPLLMSVRLEPGASGVSISPKPTGDPISNDAGEKLYALESIRLAPGEALDVTVSYRLGGATGMGDTTTILLLAAAGLLIVAVVALVFAADRDRRRRAGSVDVLEESGKTDSDPVTEAEDDTEELTF